MTKKGGIMWTAPNGNTATVGSLSGNADPILGLSDLNKKVNIADAHFHTPGPDVTNSPIYSTDNSIIGDLAYDFMAVNIAFSLSANSNVGISGFVSQTPVPLPEQCG